MKLLSKLEQRFQTIHEIDQAVATLVATSGSSQRFDSPAELRLHLTEGALLNITKLASDCLSIPSGNYVVWLTDSGRTVLVPTRESVPEVHTRVEDQYEIHTGKLLGIWNKLERTLAEASPQQQGFAHEQDSAGSEKEAGVGGHFDHAPTEMPQGPYTFGSEVYNQKLWSAMDRLGIGITELADQLGVDKSTVSRLLRRVKSGAGDPGGRNPSMDLATKMAAILGVSVGDILPAPTERYRSNRKATSGSGRGGAGSFGAKGGAAFTAGAGGMEDRIRELVGLLSENQVDPVQFIAEALIGIPAAEPLLDQFLNRAGTAPDEQFLIAALQRIARVRGPAWLEGIQRRLHNLLERQGAATAFAQRRPHKAIQRTRTAPTEPDEPAEPAGPAAPKQRPGWIDKRRPHNPGKPA